MQQCNFASGYALVDKRPAVDLCQSKKDMGHQDAGSSGFIPVCRPICVTLYIEKHNTRLPSDI